MNGLQIQGVIRHGMTWLGGIGTAVPIIAAIDPAVAPLVSIGAQSASGILGGILGIIGLIWSVNAPEKKAA